MTSAPRMTRTRAVLVDGKRATPLKGDDLLHEMVRELRRLSLTQEVLLEEVRSLNRRLAAMAVKKTDADKPLAGNDTGI